MFRPSSCATVAWSPQRKQLYPQKATNFCLFSNFNPTSSLHIKSMATSVEQLEKLVGQEYGIDPVSPTPCWPINRFLPLNEPHVSG